MANYVVTVRLPRNPAHDPRNKVTGDCPVNGAICTDVTGEHHSFVVEGNTTADAKHWTEVSFGAGGEEVHITRIELVV